MTKENESEYRLTDSDELTGSEGDSARRMRDLRLREAGGSDPPERYDLQRRTTAGEPDIHSLLRGRNVIPVPACGKPLSREG